MRNVKLVGLSVFLIGAGGLGGLWLANRSEPEEDPFCVELAQLFDYWDDPEAKHDVQRVDEMVEDVIAAASPSVRESVDGFWHLDSNPSLDDAAAARYEKARTEYREYVESTCGAAMLRDGSVGRGGDREGRPDDG